MMKLEDFNILLAELDSNPSREQVMKTAFAFLDWMGIKPNKDGKERLLAPKKEDLKKYLTRHPVTNQFQLYRLTADNESITVRFAFIKKFRKDQLTQLIDKEGIVHFQGAPPIIQSLPSAPSYSLHIVATTEQNRIYVILNRGDQKRIVSFKKKLTHTQFQKIIPQWQNIASKSKSELAEELWKSLDIKEVNKEFYKKIKEQFDALVGIAQTQDTKSKEEDVKQFAVRLIGRYIFCWFLKEKGIISEKLLSSETIYAHRKNFFQTYLYQLFFNTLNEEVQSRNVFKSEGTLDTFYDTIPYLNGGLFDKHPEDALFKVLDLNDWLISFVRVLEDFDFTVDESSSQYQQVAIDPEMLGRIFENLLASQNPETEKIANQRNVFGAFYTPREIVDYMVNQTLKSYLEEAMLPKDESTAGAEEPLLAYHGTLFQNAEPQQTLINFDPVKKAIADQRRKRLQEHIDKFFSLDCTTSPFDKGDVPQVQQKLSEVKILDPACGSGAFPMGVLLRLMELRQLVGHGHKNNHDLKSEILSKNIYGVDIMPMAVEIARLRAWLSLVLEAEYKPQDRKNNFGVSALPNLDFKFVCANSLVDSGYDAFLENVEHNTTLMRLDGEIQKLERLRENYFDPKGNKQRKEQLQNEFTKTKNYIKTEFASLKKTWNLGDFLNKVDDWNPFDDSHPSSFFSPGWMFGINDRFDVVIGNPPYLRIQGIRDNNPDFADELTKKYKSATGSFDLYVVFLEKGLSLIKSSGIVNYIMPVKWTNAAFGSGLRKVVSEKKSAHKIISFGAYQVFNASTYTGIQWFKQNSDNLQYFELNKDIQSAEELSSYLSSLDKTTGSQIAQNKLAKDSWVLSVGRASEILNKLNKHTRRMSDVFEKIFQGLATSKDDVYFLYDCTSKGNYITGFSKQLNSPVKIERGFTKPLLKGEDVHRYDLIKTDRAVVFPYKLIGDDAHLYGEEEIKDKFPLAYSYLKQCESVLRDREKGRFNIDGEWFQFGRKQGISSAGKEKLLAPEISLGGNFAYDEKGEFYSTTKIYGYIKNEAIKESYKFWLGLLNSSLFWFFIQQTGYILRGGYFTFKTNYILPFPVPAEIPHKATQSIEKLVSEILELKKISPQSIVSKQEKEIDKIVYDLYNLSEDEIQIIDAVIRS